MAMPCAGFSKSRIQGFVLGIPRVMYKELLQEFICYAVSSVPYAGFADIRIRRISRHQESNIYP